MPGLRAWAENERTHQWRGLAGWCLHIGTTVPILISYWLSRKIGRSNKATRPIVTIPTPQAVDLWYQETRRAIEATATATKTIATAAGLGLAAAAAMLAVANIAIGLLYVALALNSLALVVCLWSLVLIAASHNQQARGFAKAFAGSGPEDSVTIELTPMHIGKQSRLAAIAFLLPAMWMSAGWLTIAATVLLSSIPAPK